MFREFTFTVTGEPLPKARPVFARTGKFVRAYTPDKTVVHENAIGWLARKAYCCATPTQSAVTVEVTALFGIAKSLSKKRQKLMAENAVWCMPPADIDNVTKSVLDGMNKVIYQDDRQVVRIVAEKRWSYEPRTIVKVTIHTEEPPCVTG